MIELMIELYRHLSVEQRKTFSFNFTGLFGDCLFIRIYTSKIFEMNALVMKEYFLCELTPSNCPRYVTVLSVTYLHWASSGWITLPPVGWINRKDASRVKGNFSKAV